MHFMLPILLLLLASRGDAKLENKSVSALKICEAHAVLLEPSDFVDRALGKGHDCGREMKDGRCCIKLKSLFGQGGDLGECLCNQEFFTRVITGLPIKHGLYPEQYIDMLVRCGVPLVGQPSCKGTSRGSEPLVQKMDGEESTGLLGRLFAGGDQSSTDTGAGTPTADSPPTVVPKNPNLVPYDRSTAGIPYQPGRFRPIDQSGGFQPQGGYYPQPFYPQQPGFYQPPQPFYNPPAAYPTQYPAAQGFGTDFAPQPIPVAPAAPAVVDVGGSPGSKLQDQVLQSNSEGFQGEPRQSVLSEDPPVAATPSDSPVEMEAPPSDQTESIQQVEEPSESVPDDSSTTTQEETPSEWSEEPKENSEDEKSSEWSEEPQDNPEDGESSEWSEDKSGPDVQETPSESTPEDNGGEESKEEGEDDTKDDPVDVTLDFVPKISGCSDIVAVASEIPNLSILVDIMKTAGVLENVAGTDKVMTVLAPTNEAIGATLKAVGLTLEQLLDQPVFLKRILALHIIPEKAVRSSELSDGQVFKSLLGEDVTFSVIEDIEVALSVPSGVKSEIILKDLEACSSIIHVLSTMLLPNVVKSDEGSEDKSEEDMGQQNEGDNDNGGDESQDEDNGEGSEDNSGESSTESSVEAQSEMSEEGR